MSVKVDDYHQYLIPYENIIYVEDVEITCGADFIFILNKVLQAYHSASNPGFAYDSDIRDTLVSHINFYVGYFYVCLNRKYSLISDLLQYTLYIMVLLESYSIDQYINNHILLSLINCRDLLSQCLHTSFMYFMIHIQHTDFLIQIFEVIRHKIEEGEWDFLNSSFTSADLYRCIAALKSEVVQMQDKIKHQPGRTSEKNNRRLAIFLHYLPMLEYIAERIQVIEKEKYKPKKKHVLTWTQQYLGDSLGVDHALTHIMIIKKKKRNPK